MRATAIFPTRLSRVFIAVIVLIGLISITSLTGSAATGACTAPSTDYGTVTNSVTINGTGTYRIWSRVATPTSVSTAYSLEVDGANCFAVSGTTLPTFAGGASTFFTSGTANWTGNQVGGQAITLSLSTGTHTIKLIGTSDGVIVDRLVLTQDTACAPTGTGTNCSAPDVTPPVVALTAPAAGATLGATTTVSATATDDTAVTKVDFYVDTTLIGSDTSASGTSYSVSLSSTGLATGSHTLKAIAFDAAGNNTASSTVNVTVASGTGTTYAATDINQDGITNYLDLSGLASAYNKTGAAIVPARADINHDSIVNYLDLSLLANNYGH